MPDNLAELAEKPVRPDVVRDEHTGDRPYGSAVHRSEWPIPGMARELFDAEPVFAKTVTARGRVQNIVPSLLLEVLFAVDRRRNLLRHTSLRSPLL